MTDEVIIPDYAEPLELHRMWTVSNAIVWNEPMITEDGKPFKTTMKLPSVNLYSMNGVVWTPHSVFKADCRKAKKHTAPAGDCVCGIYARTQFPSEYWDSLKNNCAYLILKKFGLHFDYRPIHSALPEKINHTFKKFHYFFMIDSSDLEVIHWPVSGLIQLWGRLRKGTGQDKHPKGYRGQFARPKKLALESLYNTLIKTPNGNAQVSFYLNNSEHVAKLLEENYNCEVALANTGIVLIGGVHSGKKLIISERPPDVRIPFRLPQERYSIYGEERIDYYYVDAVKCRGDELYIKSQVDNFYLHESLYQDYIHGELPWDQIYTDRNQYWRSGLINALEYGSPLLDYVNSKTVEEYFAIKRRSS